MALGVLNGYKNQVSMKERNYYKNINLTQKESSY